ncbi:putative F-box/kelch-repeat protein At1g15680 [Silene latifolia]|uniref:putative F-box/kelch-repeat protein At1g15680 n=1 Tax=Silene latifolia TaxID=37657 RepID=UPI003D770E67
MYILFVISPRRTTTLLLFQEFFSKVADMDSCFCPSDHNAQMASALIKHCQKKQMAPCEEKSEFEFEFKLLSSLPDQMLLEILIRLPKKCSTQYKVVCRRWCSLISSSHFISLFISHRRQRYSADAPDTFTIVFQHKVKTPSSYRTIKYLYSVEAVSNNPDLSELYNNQSVCLDFLPRFRPEYEGDDCDFIYPESEPISVRASCHDLMLCSHFNTYYVVNLLTRQWIALPTVPIPIRERIHDGRCSVFSAEVGLVCYHDENDVNNGDGWYRFKVIQVPTNIACYSPERIKRLKISRPPGICSLQHNIEIYCSETRQWTEVVVDWFPLEMNYYRCYSPILSFDRMLYWLMDHFLVALDIFSTDAKLNPRYIIKLPDEFILDRSCFGVCGGRLQIACNSYEVGNGPVIHIWELEDQNRGSWTLAHKVVLREFKSPSYRLNLIAFHPFNREVVFCKEEENIYTCNMQTGKLTTYRKLKLDEGCKCSDIVQVVPPLLHQWFPTPVPSPPPVQKTY